MIPPAARGNCSPISPNRKTDLVQIAAQSGKRAAGAEGSGEEVTTAVMYLTSPTLFHSIDAGQRILGSTGEGIDMAKVAKHAEHPYIISQADLCGGSPVIKGTKFPVRSVVNYVLRQGISPEELVKEFSHLTLAQVYDALSFYYDNKELIDKDIQDNTSIATPEIGG